MASSKVIWSAAFMLFLTGALLWLPGPSHWTWLEDVKSLMAEEVVTKEVTEPIVAASVPVSGATAPSLEASAVTAAQSSAAASTVTTAETTTLVTAPVAPTSPQATPAVPAAALPAPAADPSVSPEWVFSASGESWLEVRNAQKTVLWSGVLKAGESTRIQSPLPVSVVVGRAQVVTATLRGQPFDLKPHTQVTVARFEVKE
jgi:cytoskeleton protein RodZ